MVHVQLFVFVCTSVLCSLNYTLHFYTNLAIHYSPFVLVTPILDLHNRCLGQGTLFVRKSAYCSFVHTVRHSHTDDTSHSYEANLTEPSNSVFTRNTEARGNKWHTDIARMTFSPLQYSRESHRAQCCIAGTAFSDVAALRIELESWRSWNSRRFAPSPNGIRWVYR